MRPHPADRFVGRVDVLRDGTELHLVSFCLTEHCPKDADDPALAASILSTLMCLAPPSPRGVAAWSSSSRRETLTHQCSGPVQ